MGLQEDVDTLAALKLLEDVGLLSAADEAVVLALLPRMSKLVFDDIIKVEPGESPLIRAGVRLAEVAP